MKYGVWEGEIRVGKENLWVHADYTLDTSTGAASVADFVAVADDPAYDIAALDHEDLTRRLEEIIEYEIFG